MTSLHATRNAMWRSTVTVVRVIAAQIGMAMDCILLLRIGLSLRSRRVDQSKSTVAAVHIDSQRWIVPRSSRHCARDDEEEDEKQTHTMRRMRRVHRAVVQVPNALHENRTARQPAVGS